MLTRKLPSMAAVVVGVAVVVEVVAVVAVDATLMVWSWSWSWLRLSVDSAEEKFNHKSCGLLRARTTLKFFPKSFEPTLNKSHGG